MTRSARLLLIGLHLFLAANALFGAVWVVPALPPGWLAGTPFTSYLAPALALGGIGVGALAAVALLVARPRLGARLSLAIGAAIAVFEVVETSVVGWDVWLRALGLRVTLVKGLPSVDASMVPSPMGVPLPLWLQPFFFAFGLAMVAVALRGGARRAHGATWGQ